ncbi:Hypothetical protein SCLAV_p1564 (plasmid) [Streptomyces clavuligerus]|uniref:Uncharacterized protein n=1 Tax=Streptomyces clavuligerus TaxID=1901 RepID=D5SMA2_STRCL|nr:Hypothetical protein SCLAV_p1564 [Streptomyces clavuligerus]
MGTPSHGWWSPVRRPGGGRPSSPSVDRAAFTPDSVYAEVPGEGHRYEKVTRDGQSAGWARLVASPTAVITRLAPSPMDGLPVPSSSSSAPAAVAAMITALDLPPGGGRFSTWAPARGGWRPSWPRTGPG